MMACLDGKAKKTEEGMGEMRGGGEKRMGEEVNKERKKGVEDRREVEKRREEGNRAERMTSSLSLSIVTFAVSEAMFPCQPCCSADHNTEPACQ